MNRRRFLTATALGSAAGLLAASPLSGPGRSGKEIVLGMSAAFKGPSRGLGIELYRGAMAWLEQVNRAGGVHGRPVVIKAYDDGYDPLPAIANTIRLVEEDNVFLLFGYVGTPTVTRMLPLLKIYSDRSIFLYFPFTGAQPQRRPPYERFVFNLRASYQQEIAGLIDHLVPLRRRRFGVFYQIDAYGRGGWDAVRVALGQHKLSMIGEATYRRGTPFMASLRPQVDILRKAEADTVICVGAYAACAAFIRDARDAGWEVPIANISFVGSESLLSLLRQASRERSEDYTRRLLNSEVVPSYDRSDLPAIRQFREMMERYDPRPPGELMPEDYKPLPYSYVSLEGFLNARLLVAILEKMGKSPIREGLAAATESLDNFELGIDVPVSFRSDRHQGSDEVYFSTVEQGHFVPVTDWKRWAP
jgi:ABC-type branched-subunit amino acid transport system substrate-binding protein